MTGIDLHTEILRRLAAALAVCGALLASSSAPALAGQARLFTGTFGGASSDVSDPYALGESRSIAVDSSNGPSSGDVYVADPKYHRVEKFDPNGHFKLMFGAGVIAASVEGTGDLTAGSKVVTSVATTERTFLPTQEITGAGIPAGTHIADVGIGTLTLTNAAAASGAKVALSVAEGAGNVANNEQQQVTLEHSPTGGSFSLTFTSATVQAPLPGTEQVTATQEAAGTLHVGDVVNIPSASSKTTKVVAIDATTGSFTISEPSLYTTKYLWPIEATETTTAIPYNASSGEVQKALEALAGIGAGNVSVIGAAGGPWTVEFKGPLLSDTDVPRLSVDAAALTPSGAGASVTVSLLGHSYPDVCETGCQPGGEGTAPGAFTGSMSLGVDSSTGPSAGDVYVGETIKGTESSSSQTPTGVEGEGAVAKFDEEGRLVTSWSGGGQIHSSESSPLGAVAGVTVDPSGNLWIDGKGVEEASRCPGSKGYCASSRVFELRQDGTHVQDWAAGNSTFPFGPLAVDGEAHVYLANGNDGVTRYTSTGEALQIITTREYGAQIGTFAFDPSTNSIFEGVTSHGVQVLDRYEASCLTKPWFAGCSAVEAFTSSHFHNPDPMSGGLAVDPRDALDTVYDSQGGEIAMFSIETLPGVTTQPASGFTSTSATLNGSVDPEGIAIAQCYFEWEEGEGEGYGHSVPCESPGAAEVGAGSAPVAVHAKIAMQPGKSYRFRLVAANGNQLYEPTAGSNLVFGPPRIDSTSVAQITTESATFQALVDPRNVNTEYHFEYLTEREYEEDGNSFSGAHAAVSVPLPDALLGAGEADLLASQHVHGLTADTAYRYRVVATSVLAEGAQAVYGPTQSLTTWGLGQFGLPDGRAWEMVSPPNKHGALVEPVGEDWVIQAAAQGGRMVFVTRAPTEANPSGYLIYQSVLATRTSGGGWSSHDLAVPHTQSTDVSVGEGWEYRFFDENLAHAVVQPFGAFVPCQNAAGEPQPCLSPQATEQTPFSQDLASSVFTPLVTGAEGVANVPPHTKFGQFSTFGNECPPTIYCGPQFLYATSNTKHALLESWTPLTASPAPGKQIPTDSLYERSEGASPSEQLRLVSVLPGNEKGEALPAKEPAVGRQNEGIRNVLSPDGELVVFAAEKHLYLREHATSAQSALGGKGECLDAQAACTIQLDGGLTGEAQFQTASADVGRIFFSDAGDLYEYDMSEGKRVRMTNGAEVLGTVIGASRDGSRIYFVGNGAIAPGAAPGSCSSTSSESASCNLYVISRGEAGWEAPKLVAVLGGTDYEDYGTTTLSALTTLAASVSPNGEWLAFVSHRSLSGYENRDATSGEHDLEVYEYHAATEALTCVSCNPTGARPHGLASEQINTQSGGHTGGDGIFSGWVAANVPGWTPDTLGGSVYQPRYLDDSGRLFFDSADALVPKDINGTEDVYEYEPEGVPSGAHACSPASASGSVSVKAARESEVEGRKVQESPGCVGLISSGESPQESAFLDASEGGAEVFFMTTGKLVGEDTDTSYDVYDARECSASSPCKAPVAAAPPPCENEASCRPAPTPQPEIFGASGSATFSGPGNLVERSATPAVKTRAKARKLAPALKRCRKYKSKRKRTRCEASARTRAHSSKRRARR